MINCTGILVVKIHIGLRNLVDYFPFHVVFLDESYFHYYDATSPRVWSVVGVKKPTVATAKFPTKTMVWSCMTVDGFGRLEVVHGMIKFLEIHQGVGDSSESAVSRMVSGWRNVLFHEGRGSLPHL